LDKLYINRSLPINSIIATEEIVEFIKGSKLIKNTEIIFSDYRSYLVNVNLEEYFRD